MSGDIQGLIDKIQQEGIKSAEEKAANIEAEAKKRADEIIRKAKTDAQELLLKAQDNISKDINKQKELLSQAGRDLLLSLRKEINEILEKIIRKEAALSLSPQALAGIICEVIKLAVVQQKSEIVVSLPKEEEQILEKSIFSQLKEEVKKNVTLHPSQDISAGFTISFDSGKSCFDFSDKALAEYIGTYLKPKLAEILKISV